MQLAPPLDAPQHGFEFDSASSFAQFLHKPSPNGSAATLPKPVANGDSSNSSPTDQEVEKKRRKQYQACDACRMRRVKCERERDDAPCISCQRRGFECRREYNDTRSKANRGSKRLIQAEAMFGNKQPPTRPPTARIPSSTSQTYDTMGTLPSDLTVFAYDSAEARLAAIQNSEFSVNTLIHGYRDTLLRQNALQEDFHGFLDRFERVGRRFNELTVSDKTTAAIVIALAARVTDLPIVAGSKAANVRPRVLQARDPNSLAYSTVGDERDAICRQLEQRAKHCVEQAFFFRRDSSLDSITGLLAIQSMEDVDDPHNWAHSQRMYSAAAIEQLRALASKQQRSQAEERFLQSPAVRGLFVIDSMWSFASGRPSQLTDDDVLLLRPQLMNLPPVAAIRAACRLPSISTLYMLTWHMMSIARTLHRVFSSATARVRGSFPSPDFYNTMIEMLTGLLEITAIIDKDNFLDYYGIQPLRAVQLGYCCELAYLQHTCHRAATKKGEDVELQAQYGQILNRLNLILLDAVLDMSDTAGKLVGSGMLYGNGLLWSALRDMLRLLFELPVDSEGGPPHFTLSRKVQGCENFVRCVREMSWSWRQQGLPEFEERLSGLQAELFLQTGTHAPQTPAATAPVTGTLAPTQNDLDWLFQSSAAPDGNIDILAILAGADRS